MKTGMIERIDAQRDLAKYSHGGIAHRVAKHFEATRGYENRGQEQLPRRPRKNDLRRGHPFDVLMHKGKRFIGVEIINNQLANRMQALELLSKKKKNHCKIIAVVTREYTSAFVSYCLLKGIEAFSWDDEHGDEMVLRPLKL